MSATSLLRGTRLRSSVLCPANRSTRFYASPALARPILPCAKDDAGPSSVPSDTELNRRPEVSLGRSLLEQTKVEEHLRAIQSTQEVPIDIEDLERYRPRDLSDPNSVQYESDYKILLDALMRSFSKKQLRQCCRLYGMEGKLTAASRTKQEYARAIVEKQWGWPSLHEVRQRQQAWVQEVRSYPLDPRQSFIILGKDGADLLFLSAKYDVHITLSSNPLCLNASGRRGSLDKLAARIQAITSDVQESVLELPSRLQLPSNILQRISRLTGAFVENFGKPSMLRISAREQRTISTARRLAIRTAYEIELQEHPSLLTYLPPGVPSNPSLPTSIFPSTYSVYPFLASRPLPWTAVTNGTFRVRKIVEWLGTKHSGGVASAGTSFLTEGHLIDEAGTPVNLRNLLVDRHRALSSSGSRIMAAASLGHLLIPSTASGRATISPPLQGSWPFSKIMDWWKNHQVKPIFVSGRPDIFPTKSGERILHRLAYHSHANACMTARSDARKIVKFEVILQAVDVPALKQSLNDPIVAVASSQSHLEFEDPPSSDDDMSATPPLSSLVSDTSLVSECQIGTEAFVDVMIPDRPMDMRLTTSSLAVLSDEKWPVALSQYLASLRAFLTQDDADAVQPDCPLTLLYEGDNYVLHSSSSVRQGPVVEASNGIKVVTENVLDLESDQHSVVCQVVNPDVDSEAVWPAFLAECDRLTSGQPKPGAIMVDDQLDTL